VSEVRSKKGANISFKARGAIIVVALLLVSSTLLIGCEAVPMATPDTSIGMRLSHHLSLYHPISVQILEEFAREVKKQTKGEVTVHLYPSSQIIGIEEQFEATASGKIEATFLPESYVMAALPAARINSLPLIFPGWDGFEQVVQDEEFRATLGEEYLKSNLVVLDWGVRGWKWFASKGKPIIRPEDVQGLNVAARDQSEAAIIELVGGTPVRMSIDEVYLAAEKWEIDAAFATHEEILTYKLSDMFQYYIKAPFLLSTYVLIINKDFWDSLSPELQEIIRDVSNEVVWQEGLKWSFDMEGGYWSSLRQTGFPILELNYQDGNEWREVVIAVESAYIDQVGSVGQELIDIARRVAQ
jgi:TRAP-type C4-dicarboxylate transport system substrate-binding protein